jgi:hypothetical protein
VGKDAPQHEKNVTERKDNEIYVNVTWRAFDEVDLAFKQEKILLSTKLRLKIFIVLCELFNHFLLLLCVSL